MRKSLLAPPRLIVAGGVFLWANAVISSAQAQQTTAELPKVEIISTTPLGGVGVDLRQFPGNVQVLDKGKLPADTGSLADALNQTLGSVNANDTQGNAYQMDVNYRGFTASPVLGTPQGLSVFMDGVRLNEPFGDVVSWDLVPQMALSKIMLVPGSNPVYGLNTLGGALSLTTKNGFSNAGTEVEATLGSFNRRSLEAQYGWHNDTHGYYLAASDYLESGWSANNASSLQQVFSKYSWRGEQTSIDLSLNLVSSLLHGNQTMPLSMLSQAAQGYTYPDYTQTRSATLNLRLERDLGDAGTWSGNAYYRHIARDIFNSNLNAWLSDPGVTNAASCGATSDCPANNLLAHYAQANYGANLQWAQKGKAFNLPQLLIVGATAEYGNTNFNNAGQDAYVTNNREIMGVDAFTTQAQVQSSNRRWAAFVTDTATVTDALTVTASLRYDYAFVGLSGTSCSDSNNLCDPAAVLSSSPGTDTLTSVAGQHSYQRLNPALGATYQFDRSTTGFVNYSEGMRTPSAIELACADPAIPCNGLPNAFSSDPDLKAVVSHTWELGLRGKLGAEQQWQIALFQSRLTNDIVFNQTNAVQGYFSNVGATLRRGLELGFQGKQRAWDYGASASWIDARYESSFDLTNAANSACVANAGSCSGVSVRPGDHIPGIAAGTLKLNAGYMVLPQTRIGLRVQIQGPQYARGDENNQDVNGRVPGFAVAKLEGESRLNDSTHLRFGVSNLFNRQYANFGMLGFNNVSTGQAEQFRTVSAPRSIFAALAFNY